MLEQRDIDLIVEGVVSKMPKPSCPLDCEEWGIVKSQIRLYRLAEKWVFRAILLCALGSASIWAIIRGVKE